MKKLQIFTIVLACFAININNAQDEKTNEQNLISNAPPNHAYMFDNSDNTIEGSVYIQETFMPAKLSLLEGTKIFNLKYNAYSDEFEIQNEGKKPGALNKNIDNLLIVFVAGNKTYEAKNYIDEKGEAKRGYFVHANDSKSKHKLLIKEAIKFIEKKTSETGYDKARPAKFKRLKDTYFISIGDDPAVEFPKKKKDFSKSFPNKHKDIMSFIKKNKIKTSKEDDLVKLINYINTL